MSKIERPTVIVNQLGLHARAAAKLVKLAARYASRVELIRDSHRVNAKSIMGVLMLAASRGTELTIVADGEDAEQAVDAIADLIARRFDEEN